VKPTDILLGGTGNTTIICIGDMLHRLWIDPDKVREFMHFNIFAVDDDPREAARSLCDEHVNKMITETAQMLSVAHRVLAGQPVKTLTKTGRWKVEFVLPDPLDKILYKTTHLNHGCTVWARASDANYRWLAEHGLEMAVEFTRRRGKPHKAGKLIKSHLSEPPANIPKGPRTPFYMGMPERFHGIDPVEAYRKFYVECKPFATWKWGAQPPDWYLQATSKTVVATP
jgi:hypothetical protein